jgi:hypothetical protein
MKNSDQDLDQKKIKKYNINFSSLSKLILDMSEQQQLLLLKQAKQIFYNEKKIEAKILNLNKNWMLVVGFFMGWALASFLYLYLTIV